MIILGDGEEMCRTFWNEFEKFLFLVVPCQCLWFGSENVLIVIISREMREGAASFGE